jgi:type III secretion protein U
MAAEKTEQPTPKRLRDSRKKGQVAKSQDVTTAAVMTAAFATIGIMWDWLLQQLKELILLPAAFYSQPFDQAFQQVAYGVLTKALLLSLPVVLAGSIAGAAGSFLQVGPLLSFEPLKPELKKLNPLAKAKEIFSVKNAVEFIKSVLKVAIIGIIVAWIIRSTIGPLTRLPYGGEAALLASLGPIMKAVAINVIIAYVAIAGFDYFFQKHQHIKQLKMSKDEVKREYKESEGDPQIKSKRRQLHQELLANSQVQRTRQATVVVTNPTHLAVAIHYNEEDNVLPTVLAKGEDHLAQRMIAAAREEGIPIMQNIPLARALYADVSVDRYIPPDLIEPMAEVLRWVKELKADGRV